MRLVGQPFAILSVLLSRPGELVTREELRARLWAGDTFVDFVSVAGRHRLHGDRRISADFDKAVLKPEGKAAIDTEIIAKLRDVQKLELVLVTGHTDRIGTQAYNQKLSERRADAVRDYLVSKGVARDKIETLGMGKTQPVPGVVCTMTAMKELIACLAPNRRVEVEVKGEGIRR